MVILQIWGSVLRIKEATTTRRSNHCLQATINQAIRTYQRTTTKECAERTAKCIYKWRLRGPKNLLHQCFSLSCYNCWQCWFDVDLGRALCGGCVNKEIWRTLSLPPINKFVDELFWVETTYVYIVSYLKETNLNPNFFVGCPVHLIHHIFYRTQVSMGSDLWVLMSVRPSVQDYVQT